MAARVIHGRTLAILAVALTAVFGCRHLATDKDRQAAAIYYDLGVQAQQNGDLQGAFREFQRAADLDPALPEAQQAMGLLLHLVFHKPDEARARYLKALEIRPDFSEAKVNLANLYLSEDRYDDAVKLYEEALNDMLYPTPYIAMGNLGWALYQRGEAERGLDSIRAAITTNPKFCQGYRTLALIYEEQKDWSRACPEWKRYREACPQRAEPFVRAATCLARTGDAAGARAVLSQCVNEVQEAPSKEECRARLEQLGGSPSPGGT